MNEKLHHIFMNILKNKQFGNIIVAISKLDYFEENLQGRYK